MALVFKTPKIKKEREKGKNKKIKSLIIGKRIGCYYCRRESKPICIIKYIF